MENDTMELSVKRLTQGCCIFFNPIDTDIQLCFKGGFDRGRQVKSDDVGIIIMLQKITVDSEQMIIVTKNNIE